MEESFLVLISEEKCGKPKILKLLIGKNKGRDVQGSLENLAGTFYEENFLAGTGNRKQFSGNQELVLEQFHNVGKTSFYSF